jgi:MFS family permease
LVSLQRWLAVLLEQPEWVGFFLLGLAAAVTLAGRHGQRLLNGAVLGAGLAALAFLGLRSELGAQSMAPGIAAMALAAACLAFGLLAPGWSTAFLVAAILGALGGVVARQLGYLAIGGAAPMAGIGLFLGLANHRSLAVWLPPLFCAPCVVAGAALVWLPRRPRVHDLEEVEWALGITFGVLLPLLALSIEREHRRRVGLETRARLAAEQEAKEAQERKKAAFRRSQGIEDKKQTH